jgi:hypothetical protein
MKKEVQKEVSNILIYQMGETCARLDTARDLIIRSYLFGALGRGSKETKALKKMADDLKKISQENIGF